MIGVLLDTGAYTNIIIIIPRNFIMTICNLICIQLFIDS